MYPTDSELVAAFTDLGRILPLESVVFDHYNTIIQSAILSASPNLAVQLAQIKLETNRRLYWACVEVQR